MPKRVVPSHRSPMAGTISMTKRVVSSRRSPVTGTVPSRYFGWEDPLEPGLVSSIQLGRLIQAGFGWHGCPSSLMNCCIVRKPSWCCSRSGVAVLHPARTSSAIGGPQTVNKDYPEWPLSGVMGRSHALHLRRMAQLKDVGSLPRCASSSTDVPQLARRNSGGASTAASTECSFHTALDVNPTLPRNSATLEATCSTASLDVPLLPVVEASSTASQEAIVHNSAGVSSDAGWIFRGQSFIHPCARPPLWLLAAVTLAGGAVALACTVFAEQLIAWLGLTSKQQLVAELVRLASIPAAGTP